MLAAQSLFDYDHAVPFEIETGPFSPRKDIRITAGSFQAMKGRRMDFILAEPSGKGSRRPVVIFQRGGGQSMAHYIGEAALLAKAGVIAIILEAPYRRPAGAPPFPKREALREHPVHVVIGIRRALDWLLAREDTDAARVGYVGHSYGGNAGAVLSAVEKRIQTFVLIGLVAEYSKHVAENQSGYWKNYRAALSAPELAQTLELLRPVDPGRFLPKSGPAAVLVQCGRLDMEDVKRDCEVAYGAAGQPKRLRWYDVDHEFVNAEAMLDRMRWMGERLRVTEIGEVLRR